MSLQVYSEIGRLRRVLVHRPGLEIDWMVPSMMERLLFDDILYGRQARAEHDAFRGVLEAAGVETLDPQTLLAEVLADGSVRASLLGELAGQEAFSAAVLKELEQLAPEQLGEVLVTGLQARQQRQGRGLAGFYRLAPVPNYFFQRDPQVVVGNQILVSSMATEARGREPSLSRSVFAHHPRLSDHQGFIELGANAEEGMESRPHLEGGDLLVASADTLLVGLSERTNRWGIERLAKRLMAAGEAGKFRWLIVIELPARRSYMHLDTVFTFIDHRYCLAHMPVIAPDGGEAGRVYRIDLRAEQLAYTLRADLPRALAEVGIDIELVPCGGSSLIDQQREQWTDGANAFAIAPGVIVTYRRNRLTAEELHQRGWRVITDQQVLDGEPLLDQGPTVVTMRDNELSRARGGPRCMTMPLEREALGA